MDTTPPSHRSSRTRSASRLSPLRCFNDLEFETLNVGPSPSHSPSVSSPKPPNSVPIRDILLMSPSLVRKKSSLSAEKLEIADNGVELSGGRRRSRIRNVASPRSCRRSRRRLEIELVKEEKDLGSGEQIHKPKKKKHSGRYKKDKLGLVPIPSPKSIEGEGENLDRISEQIYDLVLWRDAAKSSLWFGFGSLCFLSSFFANGVSISVVSVVSQVGLLFLVVSFFSNTFRPSDNVEVKPERRLTEEDIRRIARLILPSTNLAISKTRELFSGEPAMTLKVIPFLLVGAECGHLFTLWRLSAFGFFISFIVPKLYSSCSSQICIKAESFKDWAVERWGGCSYKKTIAASVLIAFWNLTSIRTRIFAAFICFVVIRYCRQNSEEKAEEETVIGEVKKKRDENEDHKALIVFE
ncbi:unnamed protein product [Cuscuta epithymum]|uniref:Reticulon-like protein n=1 Tax=Cuscuta epithymum TaxID=186058 RepID=A0AAV0GGJ7_9ASTE|nr:unnamed protein product [Cuscuta epithymum]